MAFDSRQRLGYALKSWHDWLALGLGSGLSPWAPGTVGTLAAVPLAWALLHLSPWLMLGLTLVGFGVGVWVCGISAHRAQVHDHPAIVWDEWVGYCIVLIGSSQTLLNLLIAFILFRVLDIAKPWPIGWVDRRVNGGLGIMLDDALAGIMGWAVMQAIGYGWA